MEVSRHLLILIFQTSASNMILSLRDKQTRKEHTDRELARVLTDLINVLVPWLVLQASPHSNSSFHSKIKKITSL